MIEIVLSLAMCKVFLDDEIARDLEDIKNGIFVNYLLSSIPYACLSILLIISFYKHFILAIIITTFFRWFYFDAILNLKRGLPLNYLGVKEDGRGAVTDRFLYFIQEKFNLKPILTKCILLSITLSAYFILLYYGPIS